MYLHHVTETLSSLSKSSPFSCSPQRDICTLMAIVALVTTARMWKNPMSAAIIKNVETVGSIHNMGHY